MVQENGIDLFKYAITSNFYLRGFDSSKMVDTLFEEVSADSNISLDKMIEKTDKIDNEQIVQKATDN